MTGCFADKICLTLETGNAAVVASLKQWHVIVFKFVEMVVFLEIRHAWLSNCSVFESLTFERSCAARAIKSSTVGWCNSPSVFRSFFQENADYANSEGSNVVSQAAL